MIPILETSRRKNSLRIMLVAGEASGDKHGAELAKALQRLDPERPPRIFGAGGVEMRAAGVETLVDARDVAIMGIPEIASALPRLYRAYRELVSAAISLKPDVVVLIDWPDFNLRLAERLHQYGFKIVYYISPQVWAWRRYRVKAIRRLVDRMLVILPFEREFYQRFGVEVEYVGHPLVGVVGVSSTREEFAARHGLDPARAIVALMPGSRGKEIHYHVPPMVEAAATLNEAGINWPQAAGIACAASLSGSSVTVDSVAPTRIDEPDLARNNRPQFVIPLASTINRQAVQAMIEGSTAEIKIVERDTYNAVGHSCFAVVASGTATIETALLGIPMVIVYKGSELNWRLIRPLIHLDTFGMANLIAGKKIVPELIQHDLTGPAIAREVESIVTSPERIVQMKEDLAEVKRRLNTEGRPADRAARSVMKLISGDLIADR